MRASRAGFAEILTCTLAWGFVGIVVKEITLASSVIVFFRMLLGMIVVLVWMVWRGRLRELRPGPRPVLLVASGIVLGVHWLALFAAYKRLDVATTILIVFLGPVLMAAAAPVVLRERLRARAAGAVLVAFGGIALITVPDIGSLDGLGVAYAIASALLFTALLLCGKLLTAHYPPAPLVVWQLAVGAVIVSPALAGVAPDEVARGLGLLVLLGAGFTGVLGILFFRAVRDLQAQQLSVLFYVEPASAVLYAWLLRGEQPGWSTLAGGALVVVAGLVIIFEGRATVAPAGLPEPLIPEEA